MPSHSEIRSEEIHDIMQRTPKWITRWGITVLFGIIVLILTGTYFIHYPDIVETNIWVSGKENVVKIKGVDNLTINKILVKDKAIVAINDPLFLMNNRDDLEHLEIIKASVGGMFYQQNPDVASNNLELGFIVPQNQVHIVHGKLPIEGIGKVEIGHHVILKLDAFPYREFGVIEGRVKSVSPSFDDNSFDVAISLANGLQTQNGKKITLPMRLKGKAEIMTNDKSLLKRIFDII